MRDVDRWRWHTKDWDAVGAAAKKEPDSDITAGVDSEDREGEHG